MLRHTSKSKAISPGAWKRSRNLVMLGQTSESEAISLGAWKNSGESDYARRVTAPQGAQAIVLHGMCLNTL